MVEVRPKEVRTADVLREHLTSVLSVAGLILMTRRRRAKRRSKVEFKKVAVSNLKH